MIQGKKITLGGGEFIAPPVPFSVMRKYEDFFNGNGAATLPMMAEIVLSALQRNYPELTQEEFEANHLDISNLQEAFKSVMNISAVKEKVPGEAPPGKK